MTGRLRRRSLNRLRPVGVTGAFLAAFLAVPAQPASLPAPAVPAAAPALARMKIMALAQAPVGEPVVVDVVGAPRGAPVALMASSPLNVSTMTASADRGGTARFRLSGPITQWAGRLELLARSGRAQATSAISLLPGPTVGPVTTVVGARSIVADGSDLAMAVTIPMDGYGNAPLDGAGLRYRRQRPDGLVTDSYTTVRGLLAWQEFASRTIAGKNLIHAQIDGVSGPETDLLEVPGPPASFQLTPMRSRVQADGRTLFEVETSSLHDVHGNPQLDGTLVTLFGNGPEGAWSLSASTVGGTAYFVVPAPRTPGVVQLWGLCRGTTSNYPVSVTFMPNGLALPAEVHRDEEDVVVRVGPVHSVTGAQVPDGAPVRATVRAADGTVRTDVRPLTDGGALVRVPVSGLSGAVTVTVALLGVQATLDVP